MFYGEEWVTVISALALIVASLTIYAKKPRISSIMWMLAGLCFLAISVGLATMGLDALSLSLTPYLGSLYPALLATGVIGSQSRAWKYYLIFVVVVLIVMAVAPGTVSTASRIALHSISGIVIVFLPIVYVAKKLSKPSALLVTLGGLLISVGGMALAALMSGKPILPLETVIYILHPILFLSAFIMAIGLYASRGLEI